MNMNWVGLLIAGLLAGGALAMRKAGNISVREARELLGKGALVVDVRTEPEFARGHLPKAANIPLNEIDIVLPKKFPDRNRAVLLHCQVGLRSGIAKKKLRAIGYQNAFSLGGYERAAKIVNETK
jgi:phage shock protein E